MFLEKMNGLAVSSAFGTFVGPEFFERVQMFGRVVLGVAMETELQIVGQ